MNFLATCVMLAYAQIDLRYATISIRDGNDLALLTTAVTPTAILIGAAAAATSITVASWSPVVVPANTNILTITDNTGIVKAQFAITGGSSTTATFAAGTLKVAVVSTDVITITAAPNRINVKIGTGTLTYSEKKNIEYTLDRGILSDVREGDDVPVDVKMQFIWEYIKGTTGGSGVPSVEDALKKIGKASTWISSDADTCRPYCVNLEISYIPNCTGADRELIILEDFRYEDLTHDLKAGTVSVSGKCNVKQATILRVAN